MFRRLCIEKVDWDEVLEKELVKQWKVILAELGTLSSVKIDLRISLTRLLTYCVHGLQDGVWFELSEDILLSLMPA